MQLHHAGMIAGVGLADDIAPPCDHGVEDADDAEAEHDRRAGVHVMHPADRSDRHEEGGDRTDDRPRARIDEVVVVMLGVRVSHNSASP
jgi:hypothetical protein